MVLKLKLCWVFVAWIFWSADVIAVLNFLGTWNKLWKKFSEKRIESLTLEGYVEGSKNTARHQASKGKEVNGRVNVWKFPLCVFKKKREVLARAHGNFWKADWPMLHVFSVSSYSALEKVTRLDEYLSKCSTHVNPFDCQLFPWVCSSRLQLHTPVPHSTHISAPICHSNSLCYIVLHITPANI